MTTPVSAMPDDVWMLVLAHLSVSDMNALMSVDQRLGRLRTNPQAWRERLHACTTPQLQQIARTVAPLRKGVDEIVELRAMSTIAGAAGHGFAGDNGPAGQALLWRPSGVTVGRDATLYFVDTFNHRIRRITPDGTITTLAGTGQARFSGDGGPAIHAELNTPWGVAVDAGDAVYLADSFNHRIRRITPDGTITTLAGTGHARFSGDGGPAIHAELNFPHDVAVGSDGSVYVADRDNHRIRRITPNGTITTLAGTGQAHFSGDGGPAVQATLNAPSSVAVDGDGTVYVADRDNHRIRRITPDGIIATLAGTGQADFSGDGGPAINAAFNCPVSVAVDVDNAVYVADKSNHRIRCITPDGTITTLAGTGHDGFAGDGSGALQAELSAPWGVSVANGFVHIATGSRLRRFGVPR
ncbi:hypothetical protein ACFYPT_35845 [Streptomyces sp. NPDC005529]|uniref:NHL domain-containing protein n=1 Tax=unclassified Streptomyces TaxID=2593676 RepID=UPI0033B56435